MREREILFLGVGLMVMDVALLLLFLSWFEVCLEVLFELTVYVQVCAAKPLRDQVARPTIRAWWDLDWIGTSWHVVIFAKWTLRPWSAFLSRW